ncbi:unnamed protein product [Penicillium nalgiovense]|nr:unnamed protein product [Penicillium nalgiovense]
MTRHPTIHPRVTPQTRVANMPFRPYDTQNSSLSSIHWAAKSSSKQTIPCQSRDATKSSPKCSRPASARAVCILSNDLHTKSGTAAGPDGNPITKIKLPHVGGHEGIGRVVALGPDITHAAGLKVGGLVGIKFTSRICRRFEYEPSSS